jgi:magnesium-transporting ATPase (P-type)
MTRKEDAGPYQAPKANLNEADVPDTHWPWPTFGDFVLLVILQVALSAILALALWLFFDRAWSGYPLAGTIAGAMIFAVLGKRRRPSLRTTKGRIGLALGAASVGLAISAYELWMIQPHFHFRTAKQMWSALIVTTFAAGVLAFAATMAGLWLGSRSLGPLLRKWYQAD